MKLLDLGFYLSIQMRENQNNHSFRIKENSVSRGLAGSTCCMTIEAKRLSDNSVKNKRNKRNFSEIPGL